MPSLLAEYAVVVIVVSVLDNTVDNIVGIVATIYYHHFIAISGTLLVPSVVQLVA